MGRLEISEAESRRSASSQSSKKEQDIFLVVLPLLLLGITFLPAHKQNHFSSKPVEIAEWDPEHQNFLVSPAPGASLGSEQASSAESFLAFSSVLLQAQTSEKELHEN